MLNIKKLGTIVFLIASIILFITALTYPKDELIIDDFEDNDTTDWNESGFETISYKVSNIEPRENVADIEIQTGQHKIGSFPEITPPVYSKYGSFQKEINKNFKSYSKISYWLKFSNNSQDINGVTLSFGDVVSGANQTNKFNYFYKPKSDDWQLVSFSLNKPDSVIGYIDLQSVKKLRFNIAYEDEFYASKSKFHVYIDDIKLTKYSNLSIILFVLSAFSLVFALILLFYREIRRKYRRTKIVMFSLSDRGERKESMKVIINSTFQFLLMAYLIILLINQFNPIKFLNLNYLLIAVIIFGVLSVLLPHREGHAYTRHNNKLNYVLVIFLGILGAILIFIKTKQLGWLSYIISITAGILIILLSYSVLQEEENEI